MSKALTFDELLDALVAYRGCGCCVDDEPIDDILDTCPAEDDDFGGYKDHTYEAGCSRGPTRDVLARLLLAAGVSR